ncbi:hypothetical protein C8Q77DRAFT_867800 [Trametes polyzona]|nr:hypothetical protein C8Q77DRAFT_867800 [Trametes polyzona]
MQNDRLRPEMQRNNSRREITRAGNNCGRDLTTQRNNSGRETRGNHADKVRAHRQTQRSENRTKTSTAAPGHRHVHQDATRVQTSGYAVGRTRRRPRALVGPPFPPTPCRPTLTAAHAHRSESTASAPRRHHARTCLTAACRAHAHRHCVSLDGTHRTATPAASLAGSGAAGGAFNSLGTWASPLTLWTERSGDRAQRGDSALSRRPAAPSAVRQGGLRLDGHLPAAVLRSCQNGPSRSSRATSHAPRGVCRARPSPPAVWWSTYPWPPSRHPVSPIRRGSRASQAPTASTLPRRLSNKMSRLRTATQRRSSGTSSAPLPSPALPLASRRAQNPGRPISVAPHNIVRAARHLWGSGLLG